MYGCTFTDLYFLLIQMWARRYRDKHYHGAVDTNNGTEALNKVLKYMYLPQTKSMTLSGIVTRLLSGSYFGSQDSYSD